MKVLFIANDQTVTDVKSATYMRMKSYAELFGELHILVRAGRYVEIEDGPLFIHGRSTPKIGVVFAFPPIARALIQKYGIEIVSSQDPFEYGIVALNAVKGTSALLHMQIHTDFLSPRFAYSSFLNWIRVRIADFVLPHADGIRVVSKRIENSMEERYGNKVKTPSIIPISSAPVSDEKSQFSPSEDTFTIVSLGRFEKEKRLQDAILTLKKVSVRYPHTRLVVIGGGRLKEKLVQYARSLGIESHVEFLSWQDNPTALLRNANAYLLTSEYEGYGRTLIEAALSSVPIISTDVGIIGEVFRPGEDALVCSVGDTHCMRLSVEKLVADNSLRHSLVKNAYASAKTHLASYENQLVLVRDDLAKTIART